MKSMRVVTGFIFCLLLIHSVVIASRPAGFSLPDSVQEMTLKYKVVRGLIVLPVTLNDSINVNLILDTGCRNLILFGKKFKRLFRINNGRPVEFSGLGSGRPLTGVLSLGNKASIHHVLGEQIPVVIVSDANLFDGYHQVHGVIGYDIFLKFEIELNTNEKKITFRPAMNSSVPHGYTKVPMQVVDARPIVTSEVYLGRRGSKELPLMIDTGSSLGLLLKTTNISEFGRRSEKVLGIGFNGPVSGYQIVSEKVKLQGLELSNVATGIVSSNWHNNASIGMDVLKDYVVILNYSRSYACFRRNDA
jgi:hypothetical protein